jgi:hypothetical protein
MKLSSYWLDTAPSFDMDASKPLEGHNDVAVMGGGIHGSSSALTTA